MQTMSLPAMDTTGESTSSGQPAEPPNEFLCPICLELLTDPVCIETGHSYDRTCLLSWFSSGACTCPKTGRRLVSSAMLPNMALRNLIADWCIENNVSVPKSKGTHNPANAGDQGGWPQNTIPNSTAAWWEYMSALSHWQACMASTAALSHPHPFPAPTTSDQTVPQNPTTLPPATAPPPALPAATIGFPSLLFPPPPDFLPPSPHAPHPLSTPSTHPCAPRPTPQSPPLNLPKVPITGDKAEMSRAVLRVLSALNADINMAILIIQNLRAHSLDDLQPALDMLRCACHLNNEPAARAAARQLSHTIPSATAAAHATGPPT